MKALNFNEIRPLLFGAVEIEQTEHSLSAYRFTEAQRKIWAELSDFLGNGALCTTGVRLDFHTDAQQVSFTVGGKEPAASKDPAVRFKFELLVDGLLHSSTLAENGEVISLSLPEGEHRVTLVFPSHTRGYLHQMEISKGAAFTPHVYQQKLLMLGDSITQGWNARFDSLSYAWRTALALNADLLNHGVGGGYFHATEFKDTDFEADLITVAFGCNDYSNVQSEEELRRNMTNYLTPLTERYPTARIVGILPIPRLSQTGEKPLKTFDNCRRIIAAEYEKRGFDIIDGYELVPPVTELYADHLHPNDIGFSLYAEHLTDKLK